jgi:hypothetical protein
MNPAIVYQRKRWITVKLVAIVKIAYEELELVPLAELGSR